MENKQTKNKTEVIGKKNIAEKLANN